MAEVASTTASESTGALSGFTILKHVVLIKTMKILVIRFKHIGDVVLSSVLCSSLKKSFPASQVDYLVYEMAASMFQGHPDIDNVIAVSPAHRNNPLKYLKMIRGVVKNGYDIIIDAQSTAKSEMISLLSPSSEYRIGRRKKGRGLGFTHRIDADEGNKLRQRLALLAPLRGAGLPIQYEEKFKLYVTDQERLAMREVMQAHGVDCKRPIYLFSVSAREPEKMWPLDYMVEVAQFCLDKYQVQIVLNAGLAHERKDSELFHQKLGGHKDVFSNVPSDSLRALAALTSNCSMFVGNEGGPRHFADAFGVPSVCIFSPSAAKGEWLPENSGCHRGIEWRDVSTAAYRQEPEFKVGDALYYKLYHSIKPAAVTPLIDQVIAECVSL